MYEKNILLLNITFGLSPENLKLFSVKINAIANWQYQNSRYTYVCKVNNFKSILKPKILYVIT